MIVSIISLFGILVAMLDQQPRFSPPESFGTNQCERAPQLLPVQMEFQVPFLKALAGDTLRFPSIHDFLPNAFAHLNFRPVRPFVPDHDRSSSTFARDDPFKMPVLQQMIAGRECEPLNTAVE